MKPQPKRPQSRGGKLLLIVPAVLAALAFGLFFWLRALDKPPVAVLPPSAVMPAVNARDYFLKAAAAAAQTGSVGPNSEALQLLHQGFQYPFQEPPQAPFDTSLVLLARQISKQAKAEAKAGRWEASAEAGLDLVQFGVSITHGADYDVILFDSRGTQNLGYRRLRAALSHLNAAQARAAARRLETIRQARVPFASNVTQEKWEKQAKLLAILRQPQWRGGWGWTNKSLLNGPVAWTHEVGEMAQQRMMSKEQIVRGNLNYYDQVHTAVQHPYAIRTLAVPMPKAGVGQIVVGIYYDMVWTAAVNADTQNSLLMTQLALQSYKLDHGTYPPTLLELVPGYLKAVPTDPFALSLPLRYRQVGAKYLLYSIGPDGKEDGGKAIFDKFKPPPGPTDTSDPRRWVQEDSRGDVIAGVNIN